MAPGQGRPAHGVAGVRPGHRDARPCLLPALLRAGIREDAELLTERCEVLPLQPGLEDSPFGTDGTVLGHWVRTEGEGDAKVRTAGTPDGRTVSVAAAATQPDGIPVGALRLPGGAEPVVVERHRGIGLLTPGGDGHGPGELGRVSPQGPGGEFAAGTRFVPPLSFWHALRPRDVQGSAVLRALTDESVAEVLRAAAVALAKRQEALSRAGDDERARAAVPSADQVVRQIVADALPGLTDARLLIGVAALVRSTLRLADSATAFTVLRRSGPGCRAIAPRACSPTTAPRTATTTACTRPCPGSAPSRAGGGRRCGTRCARSAR